MSSSDDFSLVELTGPLIMGHLASWALFGALTVQVYIFYVSFPRDPWLHKAIVGFVYLLEILQISLAARDAFRDYGSGWGDINGLGEVGWMWFSVPIMSAIISLTAQTFYAWRIWVLSSKKVIVPGLIMIFGLTQFVAAIYAGAHSRILGVWEEVAEHLFPVAAIWLTGTACCDLLIAGSMTYHLYWSQTSFKQTNAMLTRLIRLTVETGAICAAFAVADLGLFIHFKYNNLHLPMCMALAELYANSLLMVLNSRVNIVGGRNTTVESTSQVLDSAMSIQFQQPNSPTARRQSTYPSVRMLSQANPHISIQMKTSQSTDEFDDPSKYSRSHPAAILPGP